MQIWVDADACPGAIKQILFRAAERMRVRVTLVANQTMRVPASLYIRSIRVKRGFDIADKHIADEMVAGDLVVTADIPLAAEVVERGGIALNPRGELYTKDNVAEHLATRNLMDELRSTGLEIGGPPVFGDRDRQEFANQLDRLLTRHASQPDNTNPS